jgi:hypothetical protein
MKELITVMLWILHDSEYLVFAKQAVWVLKSKVFGQESTVVNEITRF